MLFRSSDTIPWPTGPDGSGTALARINEHAYGNDFSNWTESQPTPGQTAFQNWVSNEAFPAGQDGLNADPDGDGIPNGLEYALGTDPLVKSGIDWNITFSNKAVEVSYTTANRPDVICILQKATDASFASWTNLNTVADSGDNQSLVFHATDSGGDTAAFYRLVVTLLNE